MKKAFVLFFLSISLAGIAQTDSLGKIRYHDDGIEGYTKTGYSSYGWVRLDHFTSFFSTTPRYNRTERNTWVTLGTYTVPDSGHYLVIMEAGATNTISYSGRDTARQDLVGYIRLTRSPDDYTIIYEPFNIKISDNDHLGGRYYFLSIPVRGFYMNYLQGGATLKLQIMVPNDNRARTTGPPSWTASNGMVRLIRLK